MPQEGIGSGLPAIGPLYVKMTTPRTDGAVTLPGARDIFGKLSVTSQFKVSLHLVNSTTGSNLDSYLSSVGLTNDLSRNAFYDFYCSETSLPGAAFDVSEESGSRQGVIEKFPTRRIYPDFTITLYVDYDYQIIRLFEEWMNYINPLYTSSGLVPGSSIGQGNAKNRPDFFRVRYPDDYKRIISVTKFERNFLADPATGVGTLGNVPSLTYRMIDAFPSNITAIPVTYEGSTVTKTTVSFSYSRYVIEKNYGTQNQT
jgi:hypothetical protein